MPHSSTTEIAEEFIQTTRLSWTAWLLADLSFSFLVACCFLIAFLVVKYYRDKRISVHCMATPRNNKILELLAPLVEAYSPTFYLPLPIFKIMLCNDRKLATTDVYMRMPVTVADGEVYSLDWFPRHYKQMDAATPIVFYVPGVFGVSRDKYAYHFCKIAFKELGWRTFVFHRRLLLTEPAGNSVNSYSHYHDWREVVAHVQAQFPRADIYMVGVSMGALNIQRYLIELGPDCGVKAAVTISSPFSAKGVSDNVFKKKIFLKLMLETQKRMIRQHMHSEKFVQLLERKGINIEKVLACKDNKEFDRLFALPDLGYSDPAEYYEALSSDSRIGEVAVPLLSINSMDDLLIPPSNVPLTKIVQAPNVVQIMVAGGGHIEYFTGLRRRYWAYSVAVEYLRNISDIQQIAH